MHIKILLLNDTEMRDRELQGKPKLTAPLTSHSQREADIRGSQLRDVCEIHSQRSDKYAAHRIYP